MERVKKTNKQTTTTTKKKLKSRLTCPHHKVFGEGGEGSRGWGRLPNRHQI